MFLPHVLTEMKNEDKIYPKGHTCVKTAGITLSQLSSVVSHFLIVRTLSEVLLIGNRRHKSRLRALLTGLTL